MLFVFEQLQGPFGNDFVGYQVGNDAGAQGADEGAGLKAAVDHYEADRGSDDLLVRDADDLVGDGAEEVAFLSLIHI